MSDIQDKVVQKVKGMSPVKLTVLIILAIGTLCSFVFHDFFYAADSIFVRPEIIDGKPTKDFFSSNGLINDIFYSIPQIIKAIRIVTIILVILAVVNAILKKVFCHNQREITVIRLICNILTVISWVALVIAVLAVWGVDTTALITGAGVITLVVGLGMQSLIGDIVAGLFIVFENEFNVGDIITVDGFRGTVVEIGIRTTKLEALGNIKIINNSDIRGVLNQTLKPSVAATTVDVEYTDALPRIEEIIKSKLPELKVEGALGPVSYNGVDVLGASGVTLHFSVDCNEGDIFSTRRNLNGALKNMFDENGIGIPFPQLVIHNADQSKK